MMNQNLIRTAFCCLFLIGIFTQTASAVQAPPNLWIIGDSTVRNGHNDMVGWGEVIGKYFDESRITIHNRAIGGRSSRTFRHEGRWNEVLNNMNPGDLLLVQFGHNDGGPIDERSKFRGSLKGMGDETETVTKPDGTEEVVRTFGWYMRHYALEAKEKGVTVVFFSPVPHKDWEGDRLKSDFVDHRKWTEEAARRTGVLFVDLTRVITEAYNLEGPEKVETYFADARTHTSRKGAELNAECVVAGLKGLPDDPFADYLSKAANEVEAVQ